MPLTTQRRPHDGEALSYDRLDQPWRDWARIARNFAYQVDDQDREDLMHDIIVRLTEVAEAYCQKGKPLTKWGCIRVAQYTRLRYYHQKARWARVTRISLNSVIRGDDGSETELLDALPDRAVDLDAWIDANSHYLSSPEKVQKAVRKLLNENWRELSGYDWKLIRQFRAEFKEKALA